METLAEPQLAHREVLSVPSIGFKLNQFALGPSLTPPRLGQHTVETLAELGLSEVEIQMLRSTNVI